MCFLAAKKHISSLKPAWYALRNSRLSEFLKGQKRRHIPKCWDVAVKKSSFFSFHSFLDSWTSLNYFGCCCCRQVPFPNEHCSRKQSSASFLFLLLLKLHPVIVSRCIVLSLSCHVWWCYLCLTPSVRAGAGRVIAITPSWHLRHVTTGLWCTWHTWHTSQVTIIIQSTWIRSDWANPGD